jgi:hypothetical protein
MAYLFSEHHGPSCNHSSLIASQLKLKNIVTSLPCLFLPSLNLHGLAEHTAFRTHQFRKFNCFLNTDCRVRSRMLNSLKVISFVAFFRKIGQEIEKLREEKYWHVYTNSMAMGFVDFLPWKQKMMMTMMMMIMTTTTTIELRLLKLISRDH